MKNIDLRGHIAVITGATGNIGPAIARTLAECGADVAICFHKNTEKAGSLAEAIRADYGVRAISVQVDVADIASVFRLRDSVKADLGDADILVNAAVADDPASAVLAMDEQSCVSMFQSCVMHSVHMAKAFVPAMQRRKWGRIIGINTECAMQCLKHRRHIPAQREPWMGFTGYLQKKSVRMVLRSIRWPPAGYCGIMRLKAMIRRKGTEHSRFLISAQFHFAAEEPIRMWQTPLPSLLPIWRGLLPACTCPFAAAM